MEELDEYMFEKINIKNKIKSNNQNNNYSVNPSAPLTDNKMCDKCFSITFGKDNYKCWKCARSERKEIERDRKRN